MKTTKTERAFLGNLNPQPTRRADGSKDNSVVNFEKKHLRAYLRGESRFRFGRGIDGQPAYFRTMVSLREVPINQ